MLLLPLYSALGVLSTTHVRDVLHSCKGGGGRTQDNKTCHELDLLYVAERASKWQNTRGYDDQPVLKMTRKKQGLCHQNIPPSHFFLKKEIKIKSWSRGQSQSSGWQHFPPLKGQGGNQTRHHGVVKDVSLLANASARLRHPFSNRKVNSLVSPSTIALIKSAISATSNFGNRLTCSNIKTEAGPLGSLPSNLLNVTSCFPLTL